MPGPRERDLDRQRFFPYPPHRVRTKEEVLAEISLPCGRFKTPFSLEERLQLMAAKYLNLDTEFIGQSLTLGSGTPLNWEYLLRYLFKKGIAREPFLRFTGGFNDYPKFYRIELPAKYMGEATDGGKVYAAGFGMTHKPEEAISRAIGELLERHLLTLYRRDAFTRSSYADLKSKSRTALDISLLNDFLPWQKEQNPRLERDKNCPIYWTEAEMLGGQKTLIPAQFVFWNYDSGKDLEEPILVNPTTNGAGGHFTREEAILSGLLELIQRDGFLIYWLNSISPKRLDVSEIAHGGVQKLLSDFKRYGIELYFLDTTSDIGIPSVTAAIVDRRGDEPLMAVGAATGFALADLIVHSASEALSIIDSVRAREAFLLPEPYRSFTEQSIGRMQRLSAWRGSAMLERFSFLISGEMQDARSLTAQPPQLDSPREQLAYVREKLKTMGPGYEIYVYDVQHEVLDALGYHVVKVVVPQLIPLHLSEHLALLGSKRLHEMPMKLGYEATEEVNPLPHPFP